METVRLSKVDVLLVGTIDLLISKCTFKLYFLFVPGIFTYLEKKITCLPF